MQRQFILLFLIATLTAHASENFVLSVPDETAYVEVPDSDSLSLADRFTLEACVGCGVSLWVRT